MTPTMIDLLSFEWEEQKEIENHAASKRREIEAKILELIKKPDSAEGTTHEEGIFYKVSTTFSLNRKLLDVEEVKKICHLLPAELFRWKPEISVSEFRKLDAEQGRILSSALTISESKPSLKIVRKG